tara:strand:- start:2119 stop:2493 length:375 start_codon:yes stop_codon:yes gene_type:complete
MSFSDDEGIISKLKEAIDSVIPLKEDFGYPKEAVRPGTLARSLTENRLGVVTDAYYGDLDVTGKKIIVYTIMLFPDYKKTRYSAYSNKETILVVNDYEYDVQAYLMVPPLDLKRLAKFLKEPVL